MYVRTKTSKNTANIAVQLVKGQRDPVTKKVHQHIVKHFGMAHNEIELEQLMLLAAQAKEKLLYKDEPPMFVLDRVDDKIIYANAQRTGEKDKVQETRPPVINFLPWGEESSK